MSTTTKEVTGGVFTEEQEELRASAKRFLEDRSSSHVVRQLMETEAGFDERTWKQMADLGWLGIAIPEAYGGLGFGFVELTVLLEEMGRWLLCAPFFSSIVLASNEILNAGSEEQKADLLPSLADGSVRATFALCEDSGRWDADGISLTATANGSGHRLDGTKMYVLDGHTADLLVVAARTEEGVALFVVEADADGLTRTRLDTLDLTRKQARIDFESIDAEILGAPGSGAPALSKTLDQAAVALSAEMVGGAQWCLDTAADYARNRIQFGRPIGSFQAIKHKCADMLRQVEMARSAAYYAAWAAADDTDDLPTVASLAKSYCSEAYFHAAADNIQIHGGIGFTWEHDAHLYFRRAKSSELFLGDPSYHRELLAQRIGV
jgi:alkylation response protein AidB-like acyl-CoA dehydrogenase